MEKPRKPRWGKPPRTKQAQGQRPRGNFIRRFYYKHLLERLAAAGKPTRPTPPAPAAPPARCSTRNLTTSSICSGVTTAARARLLRAQGGQIPADAPALGRADDRQFSRDGRDATPCTGRPIPPRWRRYSPTRGWSWRRSESLLARLAEMGCPPEKLRLNRTAIPLEHSPRSVRRPPEDGRWIFLQACRLIAKKGLSTPCGDAPNRRCVAGSPVWFWRATVRRRTKSAPESTELGLTDNVEFLGWCSQERIAGAVPTGAPVPAPERD